MKNVFTLLLYFLAINLFAQTTPKTIYCNEFQNVALILPEPIQQAVTGSDEYVFTYNKMVPDSLGLLQGRPGRDSNLLIRTTNGNIYSYLLKHRDTLSKFTQFITEEECINPMEETKPLTNDLKKQPISLTKLSKDKVDDYSKGCRYYLNKSEEQRIAILRKNKLHLEVKSINYYKGEVYVVYAINNRSQIDYEINSLKIDKVQGKKGRRSSYQKWGITPIYKFKFPERIFTGQKATFVVVYPKFTLGEDEKLEIILTEKKGNRYLKLPLILK